PMCQRFISNAVAQRRVRVPEALRERKRQLAACVIVGQGPFRGLKRVELLARVAGGLTLSLRGGWCGCAGGERDEGGEGDRFHVASTTRFRAALKVHATNGVRRALELSVRAGMRTRVQTEAW